MSRAVLATALILLVGVGLAQSWVNGHTVDLVVANASGTPVEISYQPAPGAGTTTQLLEGCASISLPISRGSAWRIVHYGNVILASSQADLPLWPALVAIEVWLASDGSVQVTQPKVVTRLLDAPDPGCFWTGRHSG